MRYFWHFWHEDVEFKLYLPYCGKYPELLSTLLNYQCVFHKIIHIVNHLEYFFHTSSIEPKDYGGFHKSFRNLPNFFRKHAHGARAIFHLWILVVDEDVLSAQMFLLSFNFWGILWWHLIWRHNVSDINYFHRMFLEVIHNKILCQLSCWTD